MGLISVPNNIQAGDTDDPTRDMENWNTIYDEFNGNISADNLAADAITSTSIDDGAVTFAKLDAAPVVDAGTTAILLTNDLVDLTETQAAKIIFTIPASWGGYNVIMNATCRIINAHASNTSDIELFLKQGDGTAGTTVASNTNEVSSANDDDEQGMAITGRDTGLTATGSVTYSLTARDNDQDDQSTMARLDFWGIAIRTS
jgi:hypothetical protein